MKLCCFALSVVFWRGVKLLRFGVIVFYALGCDLFGILFLLMVCVYGLLSGEVGCLL